MKLGFDAKRLFCNYTGLGNYSRTLLKNLQEFFPENDYLLYTPHIRKNVETTEFQDSSRYQTRIPHSIFKSGWRTFTIKNKLISDGIHLYHGLSNEIPVNIHKTPIASVVTIHDLIFRIYPKTYKPIDRTIYDMKFRYACRHANRIIAISENTKRDIIRLYQIDPDRIEVIYQACNPIYYKHKSQQEADAITRLYNLPPNYLLSVGSVEPRKNLKRVIDSFSHLRKDLRIPLVVIGKGGKYKEEAREMVKKAGLDNLFIWIDTLTDNGHLQSVYQNAKALIYPSLYEGFGLPVAEALLCKTPVITSSTSSLPEAGGADSLYVDPTNPLAIASAIEKVLTDPAFAANMAEKGYEYASRTFSPEGTTRRVNNLYKNWL